jgi:site-specific DNA-methyltransferase (adenine-specific)
MTQDVTANLLERSVIPAPYYQRDGITIYHGDCREILPGIEDESVDLVFTSPPYNKGMRIDGNWTGVVTESCKSSRFRGGYGTHDDAMDPSEYKAWQEDTLRQLWRVCGGAIFYNHKPRVVNFVCELPLFCDLPLRQIIIWETGAGVNLHPGAFAPSHEWILVYARPGWRLLSKKESAVGDVWRVPPERSSLHPAPFPVELPTRAILSCECETVLDPFCGTGTTLLAAKRNGKRAIGIEVEERYCEVAAKRLSQGVLF